MSLCPCSCEPMGVVMPLQLGAMEREDTDLASVTQLMDCAILSEWAMDKEPPDRWWSGAFNSREKAGGPRFCPPNGTPAEHM